ncbi:unnamed protein product [Peronospora destructor]|uniref:MARVEL domain-containing protein n=1 Tax=Peronospora destructor TaxID=86335 RepID=A0AAV0V468_9STRA|nr:unnamed protein product [Peronospora destructor]
MGLGKCMSSLVLGGALVLYVGILTAYELDRGDPNYWSPIDDIVTALVVVGSVIIGLAALSLHYVAATEKCPRTANALKFCGVFHSIGDSKSLSGTAPYLECRTELLHLVESSTWLGIASVIVCAGALMVITFAYTLRLCDQRPLNTWTLLSTPKQH